MYKGTTQVIYILKYVLTLLLACVIRFAISNRLFVDDYLIIINKVSTYKQVQNIDSYNFVHKDYEKARYGYNSYPKETKDHIPSSSAKMLYKKLKLYKDVILHTGSSRNRICHRFKGRKVYNTTSLYSVQANRSVDYNADIQLIQWNGVVPVSLRTTTTISSPTYSVSLVLTSSDNRLFRIPHFIRYWNGTIVIVIKCRIELYESIQESIKRINPPERVTTIFYVVGRSSKYYDSFPMNLLRNIGIHAVLTSHYIVLDMDIIITERFYDEVNRIPDSIQKEKAAIILPLFFIGYNSYLDYCNSVETCAHMAEALIPQNKRGLIDCARCGICEENKMGWRTHMYVMPEWFTKKKTLLSHIKCFFTDQQEPYYIVKKDENTPMYSTYFYDYGFDKISHFEYLRHLNFTFYIFNNVFAFDYPHPISNYKVDYIGIMNTKEDKMKKHFEIYQKRLNMLYPHMKKSICHEIRRSYYDYCV